MILTSGRIILTLRFMHDLHVRSVACRGLAWSIRKFQPCTVVVEPTCGLRVLQQQPRAAKCNLVHALHVKHKYITSSIVKSLTRQTSNKNKIPRSQYYARNASMPKCFSNLANQSQQIEVRLRAPCAPSSTGHAIM